MGIQIEPPWSCTKPLKIRKSVPSFDRTKLPNEEIALALGFSDAANFRRAFNRWTNRPAEAIGLPAVMPYYRRAPRDVRTVARNSVACKSIGWLERAERASTGVQNVTIRVIKSVGAWFRYCSLRE